MKINIYEEFLISKDNIIVEVNKSFLEEIGYLEREILGKTLEEVGKIFKIESQVNLEYIEDETTIFLFTKELLAIQGKISCKQSEKTSKRIFTLKKDHANTANNKYNLAEKLGTNQGDNVAMLTYPDLVLVNCNQSFSDYLKAPFNIRENMIGEKIMKVAPEYILFGYKDIKNYIDKFRRPYYAEEECINLNNDKQQYWNIAVIPMFENEKIQYIILSLANVTEKVVNRKIIEQKNEELEAVIENMSEEMVIFDKDFNILISNKKIEESFLIGDPRLNNLAHIMEDVVAFDKDNKLISYGDFPFQRITRGESIEEYLVKIKNGSEVAYRGVSGSPIYDIDGNFSVGVMIYRDIGDRIKEEEAELINVQNDLLSKVVESLDLEFVRCSYPDFKIISINGNGINSLNEISKEYKSKICPIGKNYFDFYPENEEYKRKELYDNLSQKEKLSLIEYTSKTIDGDQRFFKTISQPILGLNNKTVELIFITIDITDEVKARNKVEDTLDMQNQMFSIISHELKTPLSVIFSASQLIELDLNKEINKIKKEHISESVDVIKQNCYRFTKLINNIIDLSRMESGFYRLNFTNRNIIEIVEDIVNSVRSYVEDKGLTIIFDSEIEEKIIAVDIDKMERIILNLISNAVKFSPKGGYVYIDIKDKDDFIEILVHDSGEGIKKEDLKTIFDKYKKLDNSLTRNAEGSGIGLALVKTMVDLIGGEISVESKHGEGSLFTLKIPVKVLDEVEIIPTIEHLDSRIEQINIEFSDIYSK